MSPDLYEILCLTDRADSVAIKAAYRALAKECHPDLNIGDPGAQRRFMAINRAYRILRNPQTRAVYDLRRSRRKASARARMRDQIAIGIATCITTVSCAFVALSTMTGQGPSPVEIAGTASLQSFNGGSAAVAAPSASRSEPAAAATAASAGGDRDDRTTIASAQSSPEDSGFAAVRTRMDWSQFEQSWAAQPRKSPATDATASAITPIEQTPQVEIMPASDVPAAAHPTAAPASVAGVAAAQSAPVEPAGKAVASATPSIGITDQRQPPLAGSAGTVKPSRELAMRTRYQDTNAGFSLSYPAGIFKLAGDDIEGRGRLLVSRDGRAVLRIYSRPNRGAKSLAEYQRRQMKERYGDAKFDETEMHAAGFVLSGVVGAERFFERTAFSCDGRTVHGWLLVYPADERPNYDAIIAEVESSYSLAKGAASRCGEAGAGRARARTRLGRLEAAGPDGIARVE